MARKYSVAEARKQLPRLLHEVEDGQAVEITRRGTSVAVVLSLGDYRALSRSGSDFGKNYDTWRRTVNDADIGVEPDYFESLRDKSLGREVEL